MQSNVAYQEKKLIHEVRLAHVLFPVLTYKFPIFIDLIQLSLCFYFRISPVPFLKH